MDYIKSASKLNKLLAPHEVYMRNDKAPEIRGLYFYYIAIVC